MTDRNGGDSVILPNYASAVLDMNAGGETTRVMCYPITALVLYPRDALHSQHAFLVDDGGQWFPRGRASLESCLSDPVVVIGLLNRDTGGIRFDPCQMVKRVLLLRLCNPVTPQLAFAPDVEGRWIETAATW